MLTAIGWITVIGWILGEGVFFVYAIITKPTGAYAHRLMEAANRGFQALDVS